MNKFELLMIKTIKKYANVLLEIVVFHSITYTCTYLTRSKEHDPQCIPHPAGSPACKNIIVEVICHNKVDQIYITTFGGYYKGVNSVFQEEPHQGDRLSVSGRWVQDLDQTMPNPHSPWNEIHPASNIHKIP